MKDLIKNIYIFSKLTTVLVLFGVLIIIIYLFYTSYKNQSNLLNAKNEDEIIFADLIKNNEEKIEKLNLIIENLNNSVIEIKKNTQINKNLKSENIENENLKLDIVKKELKDEIYLLNSQLESLQKLIIEQKGKQLVKNSNSIKENNRNEIINLIIIKFESGLSFSRELKVLDELVDGEMLPTIEKMYILNNSNFKGNKNLLIEFKNESSKYISDNIFNDDSLIKPLLSFIDVQPSNKNNLTNKSLMSINKIKQLIIKKDYDKSLIILKSLNEYNEYFNNTFEQLKIGKSFYNS
ncbi:hypothetical protein OAI94_01630, partial [bacterium]|nr:hypothetical protein [bacterium]